MNVFRVPKFDLHIHGGLILRLKGGVIFERQSDGVLLRNHCYAARLVRLPNSSYPLLMDAEGAIGFVPRLPNKIRSWLNAFYD